MGPAAFIAGVLEGEGSFGYYEKDPRVTLKMCDKDIVERVAAWAGHGTVRLGRTSHQDQWRWELSGGRAIGAMMTIYTFMGTRRKAKIREVIARWKAARRRFRPPRCTAHRTCRKRYYAAQAA